MAIANLILSLFLSTSHALDVLDVTIVDSVDPKKSVLIVSYDDGTEDMMVVDKDKFNKKSEDEVVAAAMTMIKHRGNR